MKTQKIKKRFKIFGRHLKLTFIPHKKNQYRPHLIRRYGLVAVVAVVFGLQGGYNLATSGSVLGYKTNLSIDRIVADTNGERASRLLAPLEVDPHLTKAASLKAQDMFDNQYWSHVSPSGVEPWYWVSKAGYSYSYAGENLAKNFFNADGVVAAWMHSKEHRENILDEHYEDIGIAVESGQLNGEPATLIVVLFGAGQPKNMAVAGAQTSAPSSSSGGVSPITRFGIALQSLTPAALASVVLILLTMVVAISAHAYRRRMPQHIRNSWRFHHGAYKVAVLSVFLVTVVTLYGSGQI